MGRDVAAGRSLEDVFPGVAAIQFTTEGTGPHVNLRIVKKEGVPIRLVPEGTPDSSVVAVKRVDELGLYGDSVRMPMWWALSDHQKLGPRSVGSGQSAWSSGSTTRSTAE